MTATREMQTIGSLAADDMFAVHGVECLFLSPGRDNAFLLELRDRHVDLVMARSERPAAFMADASDVYLGAPSAVL